MKGKRLLSARCGQQGEGEIERKDTSRRNATVNHIRYS